MSPPSPPPPQVPTEPPVEPATELHSEGAEHAPEDPGPAPPTRSARLNLDDQSWARMMSPLIERYGR